MRNADHSSHSPSSHTNSSIAGSKLQLPISCDPPGPANPPRSKVWVIFGATGHMGRSLVKAALSHDDKVTVVGCTFENSMQSVSEWTKSLHASNCLGLLCDVRIRETVAAVFDEAIAHWGHIDIVVNCSGYGVIGSCEDQDEFEIRNQFETNFWGVLNIIQLSLPYFRQKENGEGGRYLIFSSTSGALGVPGLGPYCATKYAVEGLIESMLYEVDTFNIKATLVEPGHVRRDDANDASNPLPKYGHFSIKRASEPYAGTSAPASHAKRMIQWIGDLQPTSALKSAELVWQLGHCTYPPLRLLLGSYAVESIRDRLRTIIEEIEDWKHLNFAPSSGIGGSGDAHGSGERKSSDALSVDIKEEGSDEEHEHDHDGEEDHELEHDHDMDEQYDKDDHMPEDADGDGDGDALGEDTND